MTTTEPPPVGMRTFPIRGGELNAGDVLLFPIDGDPDPCILRRTPDDPQAMCIREDHADRHDHRPLTESGDQKAPKVTS